MPLYEYRCAKCGKVFEVLQRFSDAPVEVHEACGGQVERLISASAFQLKGSGWYASDYAKSGPKPDAGSAEASDTKAEKAEKADKAAKADGKSETKSETKPETKPESKPSSSETKPESKPATTTTSTEK